MNSPAVSVVMGVFNGASSLPLTLQSVLDQQDCDFELVVIDDGSTDSTADILDAWSIRDSRLRVVHQANAGLTNALIRGCAEARGGLIARQDCGDISLAGRLSRQARFLRADPAVVMVADAVRFVGPKGEPLFVQSSSGAELQAGLRRLDIDGLRGPPHHGATMFRRNTYEAVGGYRAFFSVAQDIDLWLRISEQGTCIGLPDIGYEARMESGSISARHRSGQFRAARFAIECARQREKGLSDADYLREQPPIMLVRGQRNEALERARFLYFVGSCLRKSDPRAARAYFRDSIRAYPFHVKSLVRLALLRP